MTVCARRLLVPLIALAAFAAAPARAAEQIARGAIQHGPVLGGSEAIFSALRAGGVGFMAAPVAGGRVRQLGGAGLGVGDALSGSFAASASHLAYTWAAFDTDGESSFLLDAGLNAGPLGGPYEAVVDCAEEDPGWPSQVSLDGSLLVYYAGACAGAGRLTVRDLATGTERELPTGGGVEAFAIAGRYVAWLRGDLVVFDLATGGEAYRVPEAAFPHPAASGPVLQPDGKVVLAHGGAAGCAIAWYSPAEPTAHLTGVCGSPYALDSDRMLILLPREGRGARRLVVRDFAGVTRRLVSVQDEATLGGADLAGSTAVYALHGCTERNGGVLAENAEQPAAGRTEPFDCPVRPVRSTVAAASRGRVRFQVRCPRGCQGLLALFDRRGRRRLSGYDRFLFAPSSRRRTVAVNLRRDARAQLARTGRLTGRVIADVNLRARALDADGNFVRGTESWRLRVVR